MLFFAKLFLNFFDKITLNKIFNYLKTIFDYEIDTVIDVGSHHGEYINNINKNFQVRKIYGFEPSPLNFNKLIGRLSKEQNIEIFNLGIDKVKRNTILNQNIESSSSSINNLNSNSKYFKKKYFFFNFLKKKVFSKPIEIRTITLKDFIENKKLKFIDILKIDTEGYEYNVIIGLGEKIKLIKAIHLEHHFDDMLLKNYKLTDIHKYLVNKGFKKSFKIKMKFRKSFEYIYENIYFNK